jgi:rubredoxin
MKWKFEKFKDNLAIYCICPNCNFIHNTSHVRNDLSVEIVNQYHYCPMCGENLFTPEEDIDVVWNQRTLSDLLSKEYE